MLSSAKKSAYSCRERRLGFMYSTDLVGVVASAGELFVVVVVVVVVDDDDE